MDSSQSYRELKYLIFKSKQSETYSEMNTPYGYKTQITSNFPKNAQYNEFQDFNIFLIRGYKEYKPNQIKFMVDKNYSKIEIKQILQKLYGLNVRRVTTAILPGKVQYDYQELEGRKDKKDFRKKYMRTPDKKVAVVDLDFEVGKEYQKIYEMHEIDQYKLQRKEQRLLEIEEKQKNNPNYDPTNDLKDPEVSGLPLIDSEELSKLYPKKNARKTKAGNKAQRKQNVSNALRIPMGDNTSRRPSKKEEKEENETVERNENDYIEEENEIEKNMKQRKITHRLTHIKNIPNVINQETAIKIDAKYIDKSRLIPKNERTLLDFNKKLIYEEKANKKSKEYRKKMEKKSKSKNKKEITDKEESAENK